MLQLPNALPLLLGQLRVGLLDYHDVRELVLVSPRIFLIVIQLLHIQLIQVVAINRVIKVDDIT